MEEVRTITSDDSIEIENHFKVSAGPGSGKTYWLTNHIKNVLRNSRRLGRTGKIACVTYTNTAAEEIQERLSGITKNRVEIGTIHSFLYKNVVKPFAFLIVDEEGKPLINVKELDGHNEHIPCKKILRDWIDKDIGGNRYYLLKQKPEKFIECMQNYDWSFSEKLNNLELQLRVSLLRVAREIRMPNFSQIQLISYKKKYWKRGEIHHEDVLYLSFRILTKHPRVLDFLSQRFPYLFIDEFQDTNQIQTKIVKMLAQRDTVVGVIGDESQSIFKFLNATRQDFINFSLEDLRKYKIPDNRRSTNKIIDFLNTFRNDGHNQDAIRKEEGESVTLYIGDMFKAVKKVKESYNNAAILTRRNETIGKIRHSSESGVGPLWDKSRALDSCDERQNFIHCSIRGVELIKQNRFKEALNETMRIFRFEKSKSERRRKAIKLLDILYKECESDREKLIFGYNNDTLKRLKEKGFESNENSKVTRKINRKGKFYEEIALEYKYKDFVQALKFIEDKNKRRTIHKAKGAEFDTVLVVIEENDVKYFSSPDINSKKDDTRILYVGFSRAKDRLFINIPKLEVHNSPVIEKCDIKEV